MKTHTFTVLVVIAVAMLAGSAMAIIPVHQTIDPVTITSTTSIQATGTVIQTDSLTWIQSNDPNGAPPLESAMTAVDPAIAAGPDASVGDPLYASGDEGQIRWTAGYTAANRMVQGTTVLTKSVVLNSANQIADHNNIQTQTLLTFAAANEAGQAVGSEDILIDGVGADTVSGAMAWNPFAAGGTAGFFPPFAATSNMGSSYNIQLGTIDTAASERFISASGDVPVAQAYSITGRGITSSTGTTPAVGTMSAFMNSHVQEGVIEPDGLDPISGTPVYEVGLGSDITYASTVSASGSISAFNQAYTFVGTL
jgi:hypothetical protein